MTAAVVAGGRLRRDRAAGARRVAVGRSASAGSSQAAAPVAAAGAGCCGRDHGRCRRHRGGPRRDAGDRSPIRRPAPARQPPAAVHGRRGAGRQVFRARRIVPYEPEAASLLDQLQGLGYRARTARVDSTDRGTWHQVSVGPYGDLEQARQDQARVRQLPGYADAHLVTQ